MQQVVYRPGDPHIYLHVVDIQRSVDKWYCYNSKMPPIGIGAMADVYLGVELDKAGRVVRQIAVKRVKDSYANMKMIRDRARLEASLAFRHPNLVEMIGCCEVYPNSGPIFLLSNYVEGVNSDDYVRQMGQSQNKVQKVCDIVCSVLDALEYLHGHGVVHRDIKPSNIMIERDGNVRLMDLGIARLNGGNRFSQYGFIGTPEYSAPEQIVRDGTSTLHPTATDPEGDIGTTTDIYALGITFYELLTGTNPMRSNIDAETLANQMEKILPANPQLIPPRLMKVITTATEKKQTRRFQSAADFRNAISEALLPPKPLSQRMVSWFRTHLLLLVAIAIGMTAAAVATVLLLIRD